MANPFMAVWGAIKAGAGSAAGGIKAGVAAGGGLQNIGAGALGGGNILAAFEEASQMKDQARAFRRRAASALTRAGIDADNIAAAGDYRLASIQRQFAQASGRNRLAAFRSGVRGHGGTIAQQDERFMEDLAFQNLQLRQQITSRELGGADQALQFTDQASLLERQARARRVQGIFQGAETFGKVAGLF